MHEQCHVSPPPDDAISDDAWFKDVAAQLHAYFAGELSTFDLEMNLLGTPFQQSVWAQLCEIPTAKRFPTANWPSGSGTPRRRVPLSG